ncbi:hypothetical protein [Salinibacterium sp. ZJ77]|uniref:hypothetical protein n=1 Tax=Salinibacterium sp. ZJ77 TaxID=2708337 RepID=UPI00141FFAFF|nr:hypothetical protein [Salinibacterium sp. ZJ77]
MVLTPVVPDGASELARRLLGDPLIATTLEPISLVRPKPGLPSRPDEQICIFDGEIPTIVRDHGDDSWEVVTSYRGDTWITIVTNDIRALTLELARHIGAVRPKRTPFLRRFVYLEPATVDVRDGGDGTLILTRGDRWVKVLRGGVTDALELAHLWEADPQDLLESLQSPDGAPLLRSRDEHFAELETRALPSPVLNTYDQWRSWLSTQPKEDLR